MSRAETATATSATAVTAADADSVASLATVSTAIIASPISAPPWVTSQASPPRAAVTSSPATSAPDSRGEPPLSSATATQPVVSTATPTATAASVRAPVEADEPGEGQRADHRYGHDTKREGEQPQHAFSVQPGCPRSCSPFPAPHPSQEAVAGAVARAGRHPR